MHQTGAFRLQPHDQLSMVTLIWFFVWLLQHSHMSDEIVQLKTLQTALTILQSQLHPTDEVR